MIRLLGVLVIAWLAGFGWFMLTLGRPAGTEQRTDAIVVPTGGAGRIDRGVALMQAGAAKRMLVSGVGDQVRGIDLAKQNHAPPRLFRCCIDLGRQAVDTRSNAEETADWLSDHGFRSVRLVTSDWHMKRSRMELAAVLGPDVAVIEDGVPSAPGWAMQVREYDKFLLRRGALWLGMGR